MKEKEPSNYSLKLSQWYFFETGTKITIRLNFQLKLEDDVITKGSTGTMNLS